MQNVSLQLLKNISLGKDAVKVTTSAGGEWELTPQDAATVLHYTGELPKGRKVDTKLMSENRIIFDRIYTEALSKGKKSHKQAVEPSAIPEKPSNAE